MRMNNLTTTKHRVKVVTPLKDLLQAFMEAKEKIKILDEAYDLQAEPIKQAKEAIQAEIIQTFKKRGEFSTKIEGITASLTVRKTAKVTNERVLVATLKAMGLSEYVEERVTDVFKDSVLPDQAKEIMPMLGVTISETEYLSTRSNEKKDARKITTKEFVKIN